MSRRSYFVLLALLIAAAGLSIRIGIPAIGAEAPGGAAFRAVAPLLMLAGIALRGLRGLHGSGSR